MFVARFLGSSRGHHNNAKIYLSKAYKSASNAFSSLPSVASIEPQVIKNTIVASFIAITNYEYIAGKLMSTNAALKAA